MRPEEWRRWMRTYRVTVAYVALVVTASLVLQILDAVRGGR